MSGKFCKRWSKEEDIVLRALHQYGCKGSFIAEIISRLGTKRTKRAVRERLMRLTRIPKVRSSGRHYTIKEDSIIIKGVENNSSLTVIALRLRLAGFSERSLQALRNRIAHLRHVVSYEYETLEDFHAGQLTQKRR